jgi:hypothetical protein
MHADPRAPVEVPVTLWIDGLWIGEADAGPAAPTIEIHGGTSRRYPKTSYRLTFGPDAIALALFGDRPDDEKKVVLQASWIDRTFLRNRVVFDAVRAAGGLAPRVDFARVVVRGERLGFFELIERVDKHFLRRQGLAVDDANLYKAETREADLGPAADPLEGYDHELGDPSRADDLADLLEAIDTTPTTAEAYASTIEPRISIDDVLVYQRVHTFAMDRDGFVKNYYLFHDLAARVGDPASRFRWISWDADATFCQTWKGEPLAGTDAAWHGPDVLSGRLFDIPAYRDRHAAAYAAALDGALAAAPQIAAVRALAERIAPDARADLAAWQPAEDFDAAVDRLTDCLAAREEAMRSAIAALR